MGMVRHCRALYGTLLAISSNLSIFHVALGLKTPYIYIYQFALLQRWTGPRFCLSRNSHNMSQQIMIYLCRDHPWIIYDPFLCLRHSSPSSLEMLIQCKLGWSGWSTNSISYRSDLSSSSADQGCTQSRTLNSHAYNELFWDDFPY
jgi:hypothetical protein